MNWKNEKSKDVEKGFMVRNYDIPEVRHQPLK